MAQDYAENRDLLYLFEASINGSIVVQDFLLRPRQTISSHRSEIRKSLKSRGLIPTTQLARIAESPLPCSFLRASCPGKHSKTCRAQSQKLPNLEKEVARAGGWARSGGPRHYIAYWNGSATSSLASNDVLYTISAEETSKVNVNLSITKGGASGFTVPCAPISRAIQAVVRLAVSASI